MRISYRFNIIIIMTGFFLVYAQTQTDSISNPSSMMWVTIGSGAGGDKNISGLSGYVSASYFSHTKLFSIRFLVVGKALTAEPLAHQADNMINERYEISALYGTGIRSSLYFASASAGFGIVKLRKHNDTSNILPGISVEGQAFITPVPVLGFGVTLFGNINGKAPFIGGLLCIRIGKLWPTY